MAETTGGSRETPRAARKISGWLFAGLKFFWIAIALAIVLGVFTGIVALFVPGSFANFVKNITTWVFGNLMIVGLFVVILALLTYIFYRGSRGGEAPPTIAPVLPAAPDPPGVSVTNRPRIEIDNQPEITVTNKPRFEINLPGYVQSSPDMQPVIDERELERGYLQRMIEETESLKLVGIPADLFSALAPNVPLDEVFIPPQFFPRRHLRDYPFTEEEARDYRKRLQEGLLNDDMQRVLLGKEHEWEEIVRRGDKLDIAGF